MQVNLLRHILPLMGTLITVCYAQAPVESAHPIEPTTQLAQTVVPPANPQIPAARHNPTQEFVQGTKEEGDVSLLTKVDGLQQELSEVRGQVEVLSHDLKMLNAQLQAYYKDLDTRLTELTTKGQKVSSNPANDQASRMPQSEDTKVQLPAGEEPAYNAAYNYIKQKQFERATLAMRAFLERYPDSSLSANAHYWLGELYLSQNALQQAEQEFKQIVENHRQSVKYPDAQLKLGYVYLDQGNRAAAKAAFNAVITENPGTTLARLAQTRLLRLQQPAKND